MDDNVEIDKELVWCKSTLFSGLIFLILFTSVVE